MTGKSKASLIGLGLIGVGCGLAAIGVAIIVPACVAWSRDRLEGAFRRGKEGVISGMETAAATVGEVAGKVQRRFDEAARSARTERVQ
ncbi:MAG: hypothetical protein JOY62_16035 [Acidobacteriaceae bacterium]|nr:hypothetical protein [Acidobacteriaceae bacterium]MBV9781473.1 hypothetical protein [Acidobacteriaceae bacterium]